MSWEFIVYVVGLVAIYFGSAFIERRDPGSLKSGGDYNGLMIAAMFWPVVLAVVLFVAAFVPVMCLVSWPWRRMVDPKTKFWDWD